MTAGLVQAHSHRHIITNGWDATTSLVLMLGYLYKTKGSRFALILVWLHSKLGFRWVVVGGSKIWFVQAES